MTPLECSSANNFSNNKNFTQCHQGLPSLCIKWGIICISWFLEMKWEGFPGGSDDKESSCNVGDPGSIPGLGRPLGEGNGNPIQYSCLGNPMDRGAWWATVHGVAKSGTQLSD